MGISTDGILVYGICLDEYQEYWNMRSGVDDDDDYDKNDDEKEILELKKNYEETPPYLANEYNSSSKDGIRIITHCSYEYPMYIVCIGPELNASRGYPIQINLSELKIPEDADKKIMSYIDKYKLSVDEDKPSWLLCSLWG